MSGRPLPLPCSIPRVVRLRLWLRDNRLRLSDLAQHMGVHKSAPGKWLISGSDRLPESRRQELLKMGVPEEALP